MDKMTALENLGRQTAFRLRAQSVYGDSFRMAINEAVVNLSLHEDEEEIFRWAADGTIAVFGGEPHTPVRTLNLC